MRLPRPRRSKPREEVRPRTGTLTCPHGRGQMPLRFVPTGEPGTFLAVDEDGEPPVYHRGDRATIDVLGPGQTVTFNVVDLPARTDPAWENPE